MSGKNGMVPANVRERLLAGQVAECDSLPFGWSEAKIGDFTSPGCLFDGPFGSSLKTADYTDSGVRVVRLENISNLRFVDDRAVYISQQKYKQLQKHTVGEGDLLVGSFVDHQVRVCIVPKLSTLSIAKADCFCVRPDARVIDTRYLMYFLGWEKTRDAFIDHIHGATRPRITTKQLRQLAVQLPPLAEQQRIIAALDAVLAKVASCRERLARIPTLLKRFRQAVLAAACSGRLTADWRGDVVEDGELPRSWVHLPVGEIVQEGGIFDGPFGSSLKTSDYTDEGVRVIRLENIANLEFIESKRTFISHEKYKTLLRHTVAEGDIIFGSFVGDETRVCVLPSLPVKAIAKADCFCVRPDNDKVNTRFLAFQLASRDTHDRLIDVIHGVTRPRINTKQLRNFKVRVAPVAEQQEIVRRVDALFAVADRIEARYEQARWHVDRLAQSVLAKAFRGELVPTEHALAAAEGRDYESATLLLERIRVVQPAPAPRRKHAARRSR